MLEVAPNDIQYGEVAVNDIPSYRMLRIRNTISVPIHVQFSCTTTMVNFQLQNENYIIMSESAETGLLDIPYNAQFDTISLLRSLELGPFEEKEVLTWFRADPNAFAHIMAHVPPEVVGGTIQLTASSTGAPTQEMCIDGSVASQTAYMDELSLCNASTRRSTIPQTTNSTVCMESISMPYTASVFLSYLQVSTSELQVTMTRNKTQVMDFSVSNGSCRPLAFVIRNQMLPCKGFEIALYESERLEEPKLFHRIILDGHTSMNFSLIVRTHATCVTQSYQAVLQCDNLKDTRNTTLIYLNVNVVEESQGDLVCIAENSVDFGDVYRGTSAIQKLGITNVDGRVDATVRFDPTYRRKIEDDITIIDESGLSVDEAVIPAQKNTVDVTLMYKPAIDEENKGMTKRKFEVGFLVTSSDGGRQQRVVVRCTATLFTSSITVSQTSVNFGDSKVGQTKKATFSIENRSSLSSLVVVQIRSKIITIEGVAPRHNTTGHREVRKEFSIAPFSVLPITLRMNPQRVNPTYRKQLIIINTSNPAEDKQIINIEANNIAPSDAKLHDELYTWECNLPNVDNLQRGEVSPLRAITNVPLVVPYTVCSKVAHAITLCVSTSCSEIEMFYLKSSPSFVTEKLEAVATEFRSFCLYGDEDESIKRLTPRDANRVEELRAELLGLLSTHAVVTQEFILDGMSTLRVYALIIRCGSISEAITKEDSLTIAVKTLESPRYSRLSYRLCGTSFEVTGQRTKNFGEVNIGVVRTTMLSIVNRCNTVLYMRISKSRSVTAGHIRIENCEERSIFLVISPYATKEVRVTFYPGIRGSFEEHIHLVNMLDPKRIVDLTLKATVIKEDTFDISPDSWSFGMVPVPTSDDLHPCARVGAKITVSNTSTTKREIWLKLNTCSQPNANVVSTEVGGISSGTSCVGGDNSRLRFEGVDVKFHLEMELCCSSSGSSRKIEEQIEKLEHKMKIYKRKKKLDKLEAANKRIDALKRALLGEEVDPITADAEAPSLDHDFSESEDETPFHGRAKNRILHHDLMPLLMGDGVALPSMNAGESVTVVFGLACSRKPDCVLPVAQTSTIDLLLYEAKDKEVNRIVPIDITLTRPEGERATSASQGFQQARAVLVGSCPASASDASPVPIASAAPLLSCTCLEPVSGAAQVSTFMGQPMVVLRNSLVNDVIQFSLLVRSTSNTTIVVLEPRRCGGNECVMGLDARFRFFPRNGEVANDEALRIVVECTPHTVGPQKYFIPVKNLQNASDVLYVVVELDPTEEEELIHTEPKHMSFRDIVTPCEPKRLEAQLLLIRSRYPYPHALLVRSNMPSQLVFYEDAACTIQLANPIIRSFLKETVRVYVRFEPSTRFTQHKVRLIQGGIVVEAVTAAPDGKCCIVGFTVVRATVRIGSGELRISPSTHSLGALAHHVRSTPTFITVTNPSDSFPVRARFLPSSSHVVVDVRESECTLQPNEVRKVPVVLQLPHPGLIQESITVVNLSCRQEGIQCHLDALRQDKAISAAFPKTTAAGHIALPLVAVVPGEDHGLRLHHTVSVSFPITNHCTKDVILVSKSSVPFVFGERDEAGCSIPPHAVGSPGVPFSGGRVRLEAEHTISVPWTLVEMPHLSPDQIRNIVEDHGVATINTVAYVHVAQVIYDGLLQYDIFRFKRQLPSTGQCVLMVPFTVQCAMSEGRAELLCTDLGVVGLSESHIAAAGARNNASAHRPRDDEGGHRAAHALKKHHSRHVAVKVRLVNLSPVLPLCLSVECQPTIRFASNRLIVPPGETMEVEASVQLQLINTQGPFRYDVFFANELNPENDLSVCITGQYYWKMFRLTCNDSHMVEESIALPALRTDCTVSAPSMLSELKLVVTATERAAELGLKVQGNPKLQCLIELQLLHYDTTSVVEHLVFQPEGATAVIGSSGNGDNSKSGTQGTNPTSNNVTNSTIPASNTTSLVSTRRKVQPQKALRLRCVLQTNDLTSLVSSFFGYRKKQAVHEVPSFEGIAELEKRRSSITSNNLWLGTVTFCNPLTEDEEIDVFGKMDTFSTFTCPSKLMVRPTIMPMVEATPGAMSTGALQAPQGNALTGLAEGISPSVSKEHTSVGGETCEILYTGEMPVTNCCEAYVTELSVFVVFSDQLRIPVIAEVSGGLSKMDKDEAGQGARSNRPNEEASMSAIYADVVSPDLDSSHLTVVPTDPVATTTFLYKPESTGGSGGTCAPSPHRISVSPKQSVYLRVVLRSTNPPPIRNLHQSALEQFVALVVIDENIPFSTGVTRLSVSPMEELGDGNWVWRENYLTNSKSSTLQPPSMGTSVSGMGVATTQSGPGNVVAASGVPGKGTAANADAELTSTTILEALRKPMPSFSTPSVLELKNCTVTSGCTQAYSRHFSYPKEESPQTDISIRNRLSNCAVEFTVTVTSQGPQPWLLLPSTTGILEPGETQPLRLNLLSAEVGFFVGYVGITNSINPCELLYLRLTAEIFVPTTGEDLFKLQSPNGQRIATNSVWHVNMGHLYGTNRRQAHVALEIVNRGNTALEFPVSVVQPFRLELRPLLDGVYHHHKTSMQRCASFMQTTMDSLQSPVSTPSDTPVGISATHSFPRPAQRTDRNTYVFDGKLVVCQLHGVAAQEGHKYFVVDPRSRMRLAFLLTCAELQVPDGYVLFGEADVSVKCKQARDAAFSFVAKFEAYPPTFNVLTDYEMQMAEDYQVRVEVHNLLSVAQVFAFRTPSPILQASPQPTVGSDGEREQGAPTLTASTSSADIYPADLEVPAHSTGFFIVRLDVIRGAALMNVDKEEAGQLVFCEHAFLLNVANHRERVRLDFRRCPSGSPTVAGGKSSPKRGADVISMAAKTVKVGGQHIGEHHIARFVQHFSYILNYYAKPLLAAFQYYGSRRSAGVEASSVAACDSSEGDHEPVSDSVLREANDSYHLTSYEGESTAEKHRQQHLYSGKPLSMNYYADSGTGDTDKRSAGAGADGRARQARVVRRGGIEKSKALCGIPSGGWRALHALLIDLTWLVDDIVFYTILLRNSRLIESYCVYLTSAVSNHAVMKAWRTHRHALPNSPQFNMFASYMEMIESLPSGAPYNSFQK